MQASQKHALNANLPIDVSGHGIRIAKNMGNLSSAHLSPNTEHVRQFFLTPSYSCDEDCLMCGVPRETRIEGAQFDLARLVTLIESFKLRQSDIVVFSGGEPLLSPAIFDIILHIEETYGSKVNILTNGRRLKNVSFIQRFAGLKINKFIIPIFSHDSAVHDYITQRRNSHRDTLLGIQRAIDLDFKVELKFIAMKPNSHHATETYLFLKDKFPHTRFQFSGLTYFGEVITHVSKLDIQYSEVAPYLDELLAVATERGDLVPVFMFPLCHIDPIFWRHYNVASYEEVVVAPDYIGIPDGQSLGEGPKPPLCSDCRARERCVFGWKPAYHRLHGDAEFTPLRPPHALANL